MIGWIYFIAYIFIGMISAHIILPAKKHNDPGDACLRFILTLAGPTPIIILPFYGLNWIARKIVEFFDREIELHKMDVKCEKCTKCDSYQALYYECVNCKRFYPRSKLAHWKKGDLFRAKTEEKV